MSLWGVIEESLRSLWGVFEKSMWSRTLYFVQINLWRQENFICGFSKDQTSHSICEINFCSMDCIEYHYWVFDQFLTKIMEYILKLLRFNILGVGPMGWGMIIYIDFLLMNTPLHRGAFCQFPFRWIYCYGNNKSTGKETGKTLLCALHCSLYFQLVLTRLSPESTVFIFSWIKKRCCVVDIKVELLNWTMIIRLWPYEKIT